MKTQADILDWIEGACEEFPDPATPVGLLFARFDTSLVVASRERRPTDDVTCRWIDNRLVLEILSNDVPLRIDPRGPQFTGPFEELEAFGAAKIAPGLWSLVPSFNVPNFLHAFIVVYDVPSPAPWGTG